MKKRKHYKIVCDYFRLGSFISSDQQYIYEIVDYLVEEGYSGHVDILRFNKQGDLVHTLLLEFYGNHKG